eukprot:TRINITY_DN66837_c7_g1_i1.p1 TRINITY_DN66837_c7_g1~~TRINITY_DN66837_c7_g1_i1.p1  ORF type:complete len:311 (+),score=111.52 TRINITY_DN66837_c7_g1_i1:98-934(+)
MAEVDEDGEPIYLVGLEAELGEQEALFKPSFSGQVHDYVVEVHDSSVKHVRLRVKLGQAAIAQGAQARIDGKFVGDGELSDALPVPDDRGGTHAFAVAIAVPDDAVWSPLDIYHLTLTRDWPKGKPHLKSLDVQRTVKIDPPFQPSVHDYALHVPIEQEAIVLVPSAYYDGLDVVIKPALGPRDHVQSGHPTSDIPAPFGESSFSIIVQSPTSGIQDVVYSFSVMRPYPNQTTGCDNDCKHLVGPPPLCIVHPVTGMPTCVCADYSDASQCTYRSTAK